MREGAERVIRLPNGMELAVDDGVYSRGSVRVGIPVSGASYSPGDPPVVAVRTDLDDLISQVEDALTALKAEQKRLFLKRAEKRIDMQPATPESAPRYAEHIKKIITEAGIEGQTRDETSGGE